MQLEKIAAYHKALADVNRIRLLALLAGGEQNGQTLAGKLCLSPATITHHAAKLREAGLIHERRDKNTVYFSLDHYFIKSHATAIVELIAKQANAREEAEPVEDNKKLRDSVIRNFFTSDGRIKHIPAQLKKKLIVLEHMIAGLEHGRQYTEKEINEFIKPFHPDFATLRRELIMHQFMYRDNQIYELNPRELWAKWEALS